MKYVVNRNGGSVWLSLYQGSFSLSSMADSTLAAERIFLVGVNPGPIQSSRIPRRRQESENVNPGRMPESTWTCGSSIYSQFDFSVVRHVDYRFITGYTEFRTKTDTSVCSDSRNASCPSWCLRQQRAERAGNPLQRRVRIPFENWRDHRFLWCVPANLFVWKCKS